jgi:hypothetical protein
MSQNKLRRSAFLTIFQKLC